MNAKEKAKQLVDRYWRDSRLTLSLPDSVKCALITVDEIISFGIVYVDEKYFKRELDFWNEVKFEINKLH